MSTRVLAPAALVVALAVAAVLLLGRGPGAYEVTAQFTDASQLVKGNVVQVGGRRVGEVVAIDLTDESFAAVRLRLTDDEVRPLHQGTAATVRAVGLSGVANRYVDLRPGPDTAPELPDGGVIPTTRTRGVVDLDALLNALDPAARADVQGVVRDLGSALGGGTAEQANAGLRFLNPAASQLTTLGRELTRDTPALRALLQHSGAVSSALAARAGRLGQGVDDTAAVLDAVADERLALGRSLDAAPAALTSLRRTLRRVRGRTLPALDPVLRDARPAIGPLDDVLRALEPAVTDARPLLTRLEALLPEGRAALARLPDVVTSALPAMRTIATALGDVAPITRGLRPYTPDLVSGFFHGFGGSTAHTYDANGHYARIQLAASGQTAAGLLSRLPSRGGGGLRTGQVARCPGAAEEAAPDGSNPWPDGVNVDGVDGCDPRHGG